AGFDRPIRIRLSPADLGAMQVEVSRQQGSLAARFEVTTSAAQSMLNEHLPALRESLGRSGLTIDRVEVRLVESTPDDNRPQGRQGDERQGREHQRQEHRRQDEWFDADAADEVVPRRRTTSKSTVTPQVIRSSRGTAADLIDIQV
nr:flagellar hook-length control protein FliK [Planctomycetota bacterium]